MSWPAGRAISAYVLPFSSENSGKNPRLMFAPRMFGVQDVVAQLRRIDDRHVMVWRCDRSIRPQSHQIPHQMGQLPLIHPGG